MKTQPSISRYIEVLCILLAVNSEFLIFPHGRDLNNKHTFLCFVDCASQHNDRHFYQLHEYFLFLTHLHTQYMYMYFLYIIYITIFIKIKNLCIKLVKRTINKSCVKMIYDIYSSSGDGFLCRNT